VNSGISLYGRALFAPHYLRNRKIGAFSIKLAIKLAIKLGRYSGTGALRDPFLPQMEEAGLELNRSREPGAAERISSLAIRTNWRRKGS
jgi:hypothetical protein